MMADNLHHVAATAGILCLHCVACGHRGALTRGELPAIHRNNMTPLRRLTFKCKGCGRAGTGAFEFRLYIPLDREEAELFLGGDEIEHRKADA
jgi:hypothetical protein